MENPETTDVQSALDKDVAETSSQHTPSPPPKRKPVTVIFQRKSLKKTVTTDPEPIPTTEHQPITTTEPEPSHTTIEIAQLLSGLKGSHQTHVTPLATHQTGEMPSELDMDVDLISPNQGDEDGPEYLSPNIETLGTFELATTHLSPSGEPEDSSNIAKTSNLVTTDEGLLLEVGKPQFQDKEVHEKTSLELSHDITDTALIEDTIKDSDDSISLDDESQIPQKELTVVDEDPESEVSKLKELVTKDQVKDHLSPISPKWHLQENLKITQKHPLHKNSLPNSLGSQA